MSLSDDGSLQRGNTIITAQDALAMGPPLKPHERPGSLSIWTGTWNVGNAPMPDDLTDWMPTGQHDVYAVGAQECK